MQEIDQLNTAKEYNATDAQQKLEYLQLECEEWKGKYSKSCKEVECLRKKIISLESVIEELQEVCAWVYVV